jgi:hypothetical protein
MRDGDLVAEHLQVTGYASAPSKIDMPALSPAHLSWFNIYLILICVWFVPIANMSTSGSDGLEQGPVYVEALNELWPLTYQEQPGGHQGINDLVGKKTVSTTVMW